jgi:hypothetical protein
MQGEIQDSGSKNHDAILGTHFLKKIIKKSFLRVRFYSNSMIVSVEKRNWHNLRKLLQFSQVQQNIIYRTGPRSFSFLTDAEIRLQLYSIGTCQFCGNWNLFFKKIFLCENKNIFIDLEDLFLENRYCFS